MAFKDIKGQDRAVEFFRNSVSKDRLAHAYLFLGAEGLGKTLLAKNLAKFLNCENCLCPGHEQEDCCDSCPSCQKIENLNHPDVHWIEGYRQRKKISIDDIRAAQKDISLKAYEGKYKIFIILEAENLTQQAANCLLKTLEEPPPDSVVILTSTKISGLLPTIISRCQIVKFYPLNQESLKEILIHQYQIKSTEAHFLSAQAEGRIGRALSLKEEHALSKKNRLIEQVRQSRPGSSLNIFNLKDKKELASQIRYLLNWFRDILVFKSGLSTSNIINADRVEGIKSLAGRYQFEDLEQIITKIDQTHRLIEQNVNPKIALEVMLRGLERCRK